MELAYCLLASAFAVRESNWGLIKEAVPFPPNCFEELFVSYVLLFNSRKYEYILTMFSFYCYYLEFLVLSQCDNLYQTLVLENLKFEILSVSHSAFLELYLFTLENFYSQHLSVSYIYIILHIKFP